ncbi:MAG: DUF1749 domain-containing protein [bacterium]|nr:DUF1749 domain-containing protein [bacterium]
MPHLVQFNTTDHLRLPGLLYETQDTEKGVIINLHGNGSSSVFYDPETNIFGKQFVRSGYAFFTFNNRGAHYIKSFRRGSKKYRYGMAYEKIKDCVKDIDGAVKVLRRRGYRKFYLMGHSTGANKICVFQYYKKLYNPFSGYVLAGGGDDTGIYYSDLGARKFWSLLKTSRDKIRHGQGKELISGFHSPLSYQSYYDMCNPDGDYNCFPFLEVLKNKQLSTKRLFRHYQSIDIPTLVVYGGNDEYCYDNVPKVMTILKNKCPAPELFVWRVVPQADHSFHGRERALANIIIRWIRKI